MSTRILTLLFAVATLGPIVGQAAQTAQVRMLNSSVRLNPGVCDCGGGLDFRLLFSSFPTEEVSYANGEVFPLPQPGPYSHGSYMLLEDVSLYVSVTQIEMNLPVLGDANGNGISDLFDPGVAVSAVSQGIYYIEWGTGTLQLTWTRPQGASSGTCTLIMDDQILGEMGPFVHTFDLLECAGTLHYTPGQATVNGDIMLAGNGLPVPIQGPVQLVKSTTDPHNVLTLQAGAWSNGNYIFGFPATAITRDLGRPSNYHATLAAETGYYQGWTMLITDTNDSDGDGIPDLSDDAAPPRRPEITLNRIGGQLVMTITGEAGRSYSLLEAGDVNAPSWADTQTITLTTSQKTLTLPAPSTSRKFWKLQLQQP